MKLLIDLFKDGAMKIDVQPAVDEEHPDYDTLVHVLMSALDGITTQLLTVTDNKENWKLREDLYDQLDYLFETFLAKMFPEIKPNEFDLTPAAIVYAQDQIINKAAKEGKTYKEAMKEYESLAKKYIANRKKES